jgi:hypothetical protein
MSMVVECNVALVGRSIVVGSSMRRREEFMVDMVGGAGTGGKDRFGGKDARLEISDFRFRFRLMASSVVLRTSAPPPPQPTAKPAKAFINSIQFNSITNQ